MWKEKKKRKNNFVYPLFVPFLSCVRPVRYFLLISKFFKFTFYIIIIIEKTGHSGHSGHNFFQSYFYFYISNFSYHLSSQIFFQNCLTNSPSVSFLIFKADTSGHTGHRFPYSFLHSSLLYSKRRIMIDIVKV